MELGFARCDITPRVGVELCGFGPFLNRHSVGIRDRLWARAMAMRVGQKRAVVIACDLIGVGLATTREVRRLLAETHGLAPDDVMLCCSHTHSGPAPGVYIGWGEADPPYLETLPRRIACAAAAAVDRLQPAQLHHAAVPCEGIGVNREYDQFWAPYDQAMQPAWRPAKPELTDTTCHVLAGRTEHGTLLGFAAYFGCHPVVCCDQSRVIHGDYPGIALNNVERDEPGSVGLFFQGAQGDVNSAVGGRPQHESLLALDELAGRFARAVRQGIQAGDRVNVTDLRTCRREVVFSRKNWSIDDMRARLAEAEKRIGSADEDGAWSDASQDRRMQMVYAIALRGLLARSARGESLAPATEVHGLRLGPVALLGSPFETFQAIKRDVSARAASPVPLVLSFVNDSTGYAVDRTCAERGGYAADMVPLICGELPFAQVHDELVRELLELDRELGAGTPPG
jgi:hypothetical protein